MNFALIVAAAATLVISLGVARAEPAAPSLSAPSLSAPSKDPAAAALLALEEAELRERMVTGLAIAEGLRLRGRTILVAISEIRRVQASVAAMQRSSQERQRLTERLAVLERRRVAVEATVDGEFDAYIAVVEELAGDLWPRLRRVRAELEADLAARGLTRLAHLLPLMNAHVSALHERGALDAALRDAWRHEIDDSFTLRRQRLAERTTPAPTAPPSTRPGDDI